MQNCNECREYKEKEVCYEGKSGRVQQIGYSKDKNTKSVISKIPLKVTVKLNRDDLDDLPEIVEKVDKLRNEHLTDAHFIVE